MSTFHDFDWLLGIVPAAADALKVFGLRSINDFSLKFESQPVFKTMLGSLVSSSEWIFLHMK